ncbi:hypothetical protein DL96DRAFT_1564537 [Flagelloscypha sp. PMI_526]|nr:hypothetical protein DL96DRAFT_1564537 [Flagelloscypha sp. PMI_526]
MSSFMAAQLPHARFQAIKAHGRESYARSVYLTRAMNADKSAEVTAREKAQHRGLFVDIARARACPHNQVAVIPLPIVIQTLDIEPTNVVPNIQAPVPRRLAPALQLTGPAIRPLPFHPHTHRTQRPSPIDVPMDETADALHNVCISASDSSASSSSGILTPEDVYTPVVLGTKRRCSSEDLSCIFEKRPRREHADSRAAAAF